MTPSACPYCGRSAPWRTPIYHTLSLVLPLLTGAAFGAAINALGFPPLVNLAMLGGGILGALVWLVVDSMRLNRRVERLTQRLRGPATTMSYKEWQEWQRHMVGGDDEPDAP